MKKLTLIIYTAVIVANGLLAIVFKQYINIHVASLIPVFHIGVMLYEGYNFYVTKSVYYEGRWHSYRDDVDLKYSKDKNGDGKIKVYKPKTQTSISNIISAYTLFIGASLNIPLIVFFNYKIKLWSIGVFLICTLLSLVLSWPFASKENKRLIEADRVRSEQWKKELEEQKKREEMGRWK